MSDRPDREPVQIDTSVAHSARVYDYWLGGTTNFAADRAAGDAVLASRPGLQFSVRANRAFQGRVVRWLTGEIGLRQFLDIGTGIPGVNSVHDVAQAIAPESRVVYTDNDPLVLAHAHELLRTTGEGATAFINGDMRATDTLLARAAQTLDLGRPVGVMLLGVLHHLQDADDPYGIVARLVEAVPSGSYLVISHPAGDLLPDTQAEASKRYNQHVATQQRLRSREEVIRFFDGLDLVEPGLTQWHLWRPDPDDPIPSGVVSGHCGVARIP